MLFREAQAALAGRSGLVGSFVVIPRMRTNISLRLNLIEPQSAERTHKSDYENGFLRSRAHAAADPLINRGGVDLEVARHAGHAVLAHEARESRVPT